MELASIYLDETKLDKNNKFTINFLTTESDFNVFFNKNTTCYVTNLDINLILDKESNTQTYHDNVKKLSEISNKLIKSKYVSDSDDTSIDSIYLLLNPFNFKLSKHLLYINDNIKNLTSFKYKFLDVKTNEIVDAKIYNPYLHLKLGMEFEIDKSNRGKSTYKIQLLEDKLIKRYNHQTKNLLDFWYKYVNCIMKYSFVKKQILIKFPRYELVEYIFKKLNKPVERKDIFEFYYRNIDDEKQIICHENDFASLTADQKNDIAIVVLNNKKIKFIRQKTIYVLTRNYRGNYRSSALNNLYYNGKFKIMQQWINQIKTIDPIFPFTHFDSFSSDKTSDIVVELQENDLLRIIYEDLNYNPNLFLKTENLKLEKYFNTYIGIINRNQVITLSTEEQTKLKQCQKT